MTESFLLQNFKLNQKVLILLASDKYNILKFIFRILQKMYFNLNFYVHIF